MNFKLFLIVLLLPAVLLANENAKTVSKKTVAEFIENKGQISDNNGESRSEILYYFNSPNINIYFAKNKISFVLKKPDKQEDSKVRTNKKNIKDRPLSNEKKVLNCIDTIWNSKTQIQL